MFCQKGFIWMVTPKDFSLRFKKVRVTKLTHSPWNCPKTAPGVQGRQELPLPSRVSVARPVLSSKCLLCRLPLQIHITCIACDVISFNGQEQLCCQTFAGEGIFQWFSWGLQKRLKMPFDLKIQMKILLHNPPVLPSITNTTNSY